MRRAPGAPISFYSDSGRGMRQPVLDKSVRIGTKREHEVCNFAGRGGEVWLRGSGEGMAGTPGMKLPVLPVYYYLDHFVEMLRFVERTYARY
jgi:hypothetical protein